MLADQILVEVEERGPHANRCLNPSGELGAWFWNAAFAGATVSAETMTGVPFYLEYSSTTAGSQILRSDHFPLDRAGGEVPQVWLRRVFALVAATVVVTGYDQDGTVTGTSASTTIPVGVGDHAVYLNGTGLPTTTVTGRLTITFTTPDPGSSLAIRDVVIATTSSPVDPVWHDLTDDCAGIFTTRAMCDLGTATLSFGNDWLAPIPGGVQLLTSGTAIRVTVAGERIFTGVISDVTVHRHVPKDGSPPEPMLTTVTAVDAWGALAQQREPRGVGFLPWLPHLLEGKSIPWNVGGNRDQVPTPASSQIFTGFTEVMGDQLALLRDTAEASIYIDRHGVLVATTAMPAYPAIIGDDREISYTDLDLAMESSEIITSVTVDRVAIVGGVLTTTRYGPYEDPAAVARWGRRPALFTVYGTITNPRSYANAILTRNKTAHLRPRTLTLAADTPAQAARWAVRELGERVTVRLDDTNYQAQIVGISHNLSTRPGDMTRPVGHTTTLTLALPGAAARPQQLTL